jgi:hypothetical protein
MSMSGCFAAVDVATLKRLRDDPGLIEDVLFPDDGDAEPEHYVEVDKAWHGIHYLLCGDADPTDAPPSWAVLGGEEFGDDMGYGPARFLTPDQVRRIAESLPDETAFASRYDPKAMTQAEIYPDIIWERDGQESLEFLIAYFRPLLAFYRDAAARGDAVLLWIC